MLTPGDRPRANPPLRQVDRQREHQANERTFLAWLRTAIALIGFGFAIARFGLFLQELQLVVTAPEPPPEVLSGAQVLGVGLVGVGVLLIGLAVWRYNVAFWQIERNAYRPSRLMVWLTAAIVAMLGLLTIPYVLIRPPAIGRSGQPQSQLTPHIQTWVNYVLPPPPIAVAPRGSNH